MYVVDARASSFPLSAVLFSVFHHNSAFPLLFLSPDTLAYKYFSEDFVTHLYYNLLFKTISRSLNADGVLLGKVCDQSPKVHGVLVVLNCIGLFLKWYVSNSKCQSTLHYNLSFRIFTKY
jgi:hypothetical protein